MKKNKYLLKSTGYITMALILSLWIAPCHAAAEQEAEYQNISLRHSITQPKKLNLSYDVYAGGFQAMNASLEMDLDKRAYDVALKAETEGFIGKVFPWKGIYSTSGHTEEGALVPSIHMASSFWRNKVKVTEMTFDPSGNLLKTTTQNGQKTEVKRDVSEDMTKDAVDMLTGTLMLIQQAKSTDQCRGAFPVFDGKRRFNIVMKDEGKDTIKKSKYSTFSGEALRCTLTVEPVLGFKEKDQKRGWMAVQNHTAERKKLPTIWLAQVDDNGPFVPVRMEIASSYGSVVAHLSESTAK